MSLIIKPLAKPIQKQEEPKPNGALRKELVDLGILTPREFYDSLPPQDPQKLARNARMILIGDGEWIFKDGKRTAIYRDQSGHTTLEVLLVLSGILFLGIVGAVVYIAVYLLNKFW